MDSDRGENCPIPSLLSWPLNIEIVDHEEIDPHVAAERNIVLNAALAVCRDHRHAVGVHVEPTETQDFLHHGPVVLPLHDHGVPREEKLLVAEPSHLRAR